MLYDSVHTQLFTLPDDTLVLPAHDYKGRTASSIGALAWAVWGGLWLGGLTVQPCAKGVDQSPAPTPHTHTHTHTPPRARARVRARARTRARQARRKRTTRA
jgi:hypothetical protein